MTEAQRATARRLTNAQRRALFRATRPHYPQARFHRMPKWIARRGDATAYGKTKDAAMANLDSGNALTPEDEAAVAAEIVKAHR